jgi:diaminopropionate ammonia-lyase
MPTQQSQITCPAAVETGRGFTVWANQDRAPASDPPPALYDVFPREDLARAQHTISRWRGYQPTPLFPLSGLARGLGVSDILYKHEGERFGLGSFKALGGAYAVCLELAKVVAHRTGSASVDAKDLESGRWATETLGVTVACATDGNHGRAVAWGAQRFHCRCVIFVHPHVSARRRQAMADLGAEIREVPGNYDDSVREAARIARAEGWIVVSDTSYEGYEDIPRHVMQGYGVMIEEAIHQLPPGKIPTHVFAQAGVGGMAAAACAVLWHHFGALRPRFIVVEPEKADALLRSARAGRPVAVRGELDTIMAGLSCGEVSPLAWSLLEKGVDDFMTISDELAVDAMRLLARSPWQDPAIVAGESGVAGLAALCAVSSDRRIRRRMGLGPGSVILLFGSEGATDPEIYQRIVGTVGSAA